MFKSLFENAPKIIGEADALLGLGRSRTLLGRNDVTRDAYGEARNIRISVTGNDGTVKSIEVAGAQSEVTEEQLKNLIALLGEADDGTEHSFSEE